MKPDHRVLAIVNNQSRTDLIRSLKGISHLIMRRRSYATEVDFHTDDIEKAITDLRDVSIILDYRDIGENERKYDDAYFRSVLNREDEIIQEAKEMFSRERYWEAHTVLEDLWKISRGRKKKLLQGIIIIAASLTHHQMGETEVSARMYSKGLKLIHEGSGLRPHEYGYSEEFRYPSDFPAVL